MTSDTLTRSRLTELVEDVISERLAAVQGVAEVQVNGSQQRVFEVDVDQVKLASLGLTSRRTQFAGEDGIRRPQLTLLGHAVRCDHIDGGH